jgi:hypothetical protein
MISRYLSRAGLVTPEPASAPVVLAASSAKTTTATSHRESPARSCAGKTARRPPATRTASAIGHRRSPIRLDPVPFRLITRLAAGATGRPAATLQPHARWRGQP